VGPFMIGSTTWIRRRVWGVNGSAGERVGFEENKLVGVEGGECVIGDWARLVCGYPYVYL
jgi:hypothetical protein